MARKVCKGSDEQARFVIVLPATKQGSGRCRSVQVGGKTHSGV